MQTCAQGQVAAVIGMILSFRPQCTPPSLALGQPSPKKRRPLIQMSFRLLEINGLRRHAPVYVFVPVLFARHCMAPEMHRWIPPRRPASELDCSELLSANLTVGLGPDVTSSENRNTVCSPKSRYLGLQGLRWKPSCRYCYTPTCRCTTKGGMMI